MSHSPTLPAPVPRWGEVCPDWARVSIRRGFSEQVRGSARGFLFLQGGERGGSAWAKGLADGIERVGEEWLAESPLGRVKVRFAPANGFGVLDHDVTLESGTTFHNPMRVMPNGSGSEVVFVVFRRAGVSDAEFERDAGTVARDLEALKWLLEHAR
jgi:hypothetical protein